MNIHESANEYTHFVLLFLNLPLNALFNRRFFREFTFDILRISYE